MIQTKRIKCAHCGMKKYTLPFLMLSIIFDGVNIFASDFENILYKSENQGETFIRTSLLSDDEVKILLHFTLMSKCCQDPYYNFMQY